MALLSLDKSFQGTAAFAVLEVEAEVGKGRLVAAASGVGEHMVSTTAAANPRMVGSCIAVAATAVLKSAADTAVAEADAQSVDMLWADAAAGCIVGLPGCPGSIRQKPSCLKSSAAQAPACLMLLLG